MAEVNPQQIAAPSRGFNALPVLKQLGLMIGLAASVALGVAVVMWAQTPNYKMLYSNLSDKDAGLVMDALEKSKIEYTIDQSSGSVLVAGSRVHDARILLAAQGLPKSAGTGFDSMDEQQGFGVSQFQEKARFHRVMEEELARTIMTLANVQTARVHLAIPKQSVFVRNRKKPSASVVLNLYAGRNLQPGQTEAIVHMVASSVSELDTNQVSIIDQKGRLLSKTMQDGDMSLTAGQFDYKRRLEEYYSQRVEDILTPIIGIGGVKAQVVADLDFTTTEQTQESYNPDLPAVRSEQVVEESSTSGNLSSAGVPGALPNQPGTAQQGGANEEGQPSPRSSSRRSVLNYELDRTISHTRRSAGSLRRLSVAVVVDNKQVLDEAGEVSRVKLSDEEITRVVSLVKDTIGFDAQRGDTVNVINSLFSQQPEPEPLPEPAIWEQAWVWDIAKQTLGGLVVLLLIFGVLKPVLGSLAKLGESAGAMSGADGEVMFTGGEMPAGGGNVVTQQAQERQRLNQSYEVNMNTAKQMVAQDPKRVAQVVKSWVGTGGGDE